MMGNMQGDELAEIDVAEGEFDAMLAESEPVEIVGPFDPVRRVRFELISGRLRTFGWRLVAANGEVLAVSATTYSSRADVRRALSAITTALRDAPIMDPVDEDDQERDKAANHHRRWLRRRRWRRTS